MRRPGARLRTIAARVCRAQTMERLIDPVLGDLQVEYEHAVLAGRKWESRWIWIVGHLAFFTVVVVHGGERATGILHDLTGEDRRTLIRTFGFSAAIMLLGTVLLASVSFRSVASWSHPNAARLALFLVPQALPISIPVGLTFGILVGLGRAAAPRRSRTLVLLIAGMSSMASFAALAWVVPASNQAFRVAVSGRSVIKGANELTLGELGQLREAKSHEPMAARNEIRSLALNYHTRWALAASPFVLSFFAVVLTRRRQRGGLLLGFVGCAAIFAYYVIMYTAREPGLDRTLPAFAAAWAPNAAFVILSFAVMTAGRLRPGRAASA